MRRLPEDWQRTFLDTLLLAEELGDCVAMRSLLASGEKLIMASDFAASLAEYHAIERRLVDAIAHEAIHGNRSILKTEHPFNKRLEAMGLRPQQAA